MVFPAEQPRISWAAGNGGIESLTAEVIGDLLRGGIAADIGLTNIHEIADTVQAITEPATVRVATKASMAYLTVLLG